MLGYRLSGYDLSQRLPAARMLEAAGACGVRNTPPGSDALSLLARVDGLTPGMLRSALQDRSLMEVEHAPRPPVFPSSQAGILGRCLVPDLDSLGDVVIGVTPLLMEMDPKMRRTRHMVEEAVRNELDGKGMTKTELAVRSARRIARQLDDVRREVWAQPFVNTDISKGEAVVRLMSYVLGMNGAVCFSEHLGHSSPLALTERWLGHGVEGGDCRELVRRYLRCYGPSTEKLFAERSGLGVEHASKPWSTMEKDMNDIGIGGRTMWHLDEQMELFENADLPQGVRLLPPHDPCLQQRDRSILVREPERRREMWRAVGSPGAVPCDGEIVGTWQSRKKGVNLDLEVRLHQELPGDRMEDVVREADLMAPLRDVRRVEVILA